MKPLLLLACLAGGVGAWEGGWWLHRRNRRRTVYEQARATAAQLGRPLVVIGAPDAGTTANYGCGDITIDLCYSACPRSIQADITQGLPFDDNSVVTFTSCVLEYIRGDVQAAINEIHRVSGPYAFFVGVEPHTLVGRLHPGRQRCMPRQYR